ncbi:MAG: DUF3995 domain-containing protein [Ornithinimicrobium sp.]
MTIRMRTETAGRGAALVATTGLSAAAGLHAAWATGSSWPAADQDELADLVVGRRPFPSSALTWGVVGLLTTAAGITAAASTSAAQRRWVRLGTRGVGTVLLARGVGGLAVSGTNAVESTAVYRHYDLRIYSPLCLALGTAALRSARRRSR